MFHVVNIYIATVHLEDGDSIYLRKLVSHSSSQYRNHIVSGEVLLSRFMLSLIAFLCDPHVRCIHKAVRIWLLQPITPTINLTSVWPAEHISVKLLPRQIYCEVLFRASSE